MVQRKALCLNDLGIYIKRDRAISKVYFKFLGQLCHVESFLSVSGGEKVFQSVACVMFYLRDL